MGRRMRGRALVIAEARCQISRMVLIVGLGILALMISSSIGMPASRELMIKLGTLIDMTRRANPELFATRVEPVNPFVGKKFLHKRIKGMLRVDLREFGELCQRLQRDARKLDGRAHVGLVPLAVYLAGLGLWYALKS
jgi:hypothetical protein